MRNLDHTSHFPSFVARIEVDPVYALQRHETPRGCTAIKSDAIAH